MAVGEQIHHGRLDTLFRVRFSLQSDTIRIHLAVSVETDVQTDLLILQALLIRRPCESETVFFPAAADIGKRCSDCFRKTGDPYQDLFFFHIRLLEPEPYVIEHLLLKRVLVISGNYLRDKMRFTRISLRCGNPE